MVELLLLPNSIPLAFPSNNNNNQEEDDNNDNSRADRKSNFWSGWQQRRAKPARQPTVDIKKERKSEEINSIFFSIIFFWVGQEKKIVSAVMIMSMHSLHAHT